MREQGLPKVLSWRWAPFAALVAGACSFVGFALLVIPDHIGAKSNDGGSSLGLGLANSFVRTESGTASPSHDFSGDSTSSVSAALPANPTSRVIARSGDGFPKRGFTPPLERAEPPAQPVPPPPPAPAPQAAPPPPAEIPPPQAQPPAPAPAEQPAGVVPQQPVGAEAPN